MSRTLTITHWITRDEPNWIIANGAAFLDPDDPFEERDYCLEIEGSDYEPADPSVGIMTGGFCSCSAFDADRNTEVQLRPDELERALEALNEAAYADAYSDLEGWQ